VICLHKHDGWCDITTWADYAKYDAVLLCLECGGRRLLHRGAW
jgi:hypothetical protein